MLALALFAAAARVGPSCGSDVELQQVLTTANSVSPLFSAQNLDYYASIAAKPRLTKLLWRNMHDHTKHSVVVVGVREGDDVIEYAKKLHMNVVGIDPAAITAQLKTRFETGDLTALAHRVNLTIAAAGSNNVETSDIGRQVTVDRLVREWQERDSAVAQEIDIMSIDIDGPEPFAVAGAANSLRNGVARMVILEASFARDPTHYGVGRKAKCKQREGRVQMIKLLTEKYALFDYIPWGYPTADAEGQAAWAARHRRTAAEFGAPRTTPASVEEWVDGMCARLEGDFNIIMTDILAIRKDLLTCDVWGQLKAMGETVCTGTAKTPFGLEKDLCVYRKVSG